MPTAVSGVVALLRRGRGYHCRRRVLFSRWVASVSLAHLPPPGAVDPFLRDQTGQTRQMFPSDRESRSGLPVRGTPAAILPPSADDPKPSLGSEAFPGSLSLRARATGAFLGALCLRALRRLRVGHLAQDCRPEI